MEKLDEVCGDGCALKAGAASAVDPNCDYSDADLYGGWGWNSTASQSCAPLETVSSPQPTSPCIDVDGDGWVGMAPLVAFRKPPFAGSI